MRGYADREILLLKSIPIWGTGQDTTLSGETEHTNCIQDSVFYEKEKTSMFSLHDEITVGYFSFSYFLKNMYSRYRSYFIKGNGVPELTYFKFDINQHVIPGLLVKEKASMALTDRILQITGQTVIDSPKLFSNFLFVASPVRYDHDRHRN